MTNLYLFEEEPKEQKKQITSYWVTTTTLGNDYEINYIFTK